MNKYYALLTILVCSVIFTDGMNLAGDEIRSQILDIIDSNVRSFMTSSSVQTFFKNKCAKNPEVDSYEKTQEATDDLMNCVSTVFDSTSISDLHFTKDKDKDVAIYERYCSRSADIMHCVRNFASILDVCFDKGEKDNPNKDNSNKDNTTKSIISKIMYVWLLYSCHGNKLMSYLKMGGSKCVDSKKDELRRCGEPIDNFLDVNAKFSSRFPSLSFKESQCGMISKTRHCVVDKLSTCERRTATAAINYYTSLFDVFRDMSPCNANTAVKNTYNYNSNTNNNNYDFDNENENKNIIFTVLSSLFLMLRRFNYYGSIRSILPRVISSVPAIPYMV